MPIDRRNLLALSAITASAPAAAMAMAAAGAEAVMALRASRLRRSMGMVRILLDGDTSRSGPGIDGELRAGSGQNGRLRDG